MLVGSQAVYLCDMLCGIRVSWPEEFVTRQTSIAKDSKKALQELLFLHGKLDYIEKDRALLHRKSAKAERFIAKLERDGDEQKLHVHRIEDRHQETERRLKEVEALRRTLEKKVGTLEVERDQERVRADHLQRQLSKLQSEARQGQKSVRVALQKLTRCPTVAKRIAAACHPDKCPKELSDVASELFRFVQSNRKRGED